MNQARQEPTGLRYDALVPGEMRRTTNKEGSATGWVLVATVATEELRRLRLVADSIHGEASLLRHAGGVTFLVSRIRADAKCYIFVLPLVGPEVLALLQLVPVTGVRIAFSCGTHDVLKYSFPIVEAGASEFLGSHQRRYSKESVLAAASDVASDFLRQADGADLVCMVPTPGLQTWAAKQHREG